MKKSRLFSLLCACWPGAGEMYLGLMNRGLAIMITFWGVIALCTMVGSATPGVLCLPVLWFYSFFDTLTLRNLDYYALTELQERDEFFFQDLMGGKKNLPDVVGKYHFWLGCGLIFMGAFMLYDRVRSWLYWSDLLPAWMDDLFRRLPSLVISFGIIALGIWLVRGKRLPADEVEDFPQYGAREESGKEDGQHGKRSA